MSRCTATTQFFDGDDEVQCMDMSGEPHRRHVGRDRQGFTVEWSEPGDPDV